MSVRLRSVTSWEIFLFTLFGLCEVPDVTYTSPTMANPLASYTLADWEEEITRSNWRVTHTHTHTKLKHTN